MTPKLDRIQHLALYGAFHRSRGNKIAHGVCVPIIFVTGACVLELAHVPTLPLAFVLCATLAIVDVVGAGLFLALLVAGCLGARAITAALPASLALPGAVVLHASAWYGTVVLGHQTLEPPVNLGPDRGKAERTDSNLYFRRGYYRAKNLGTGVTFIDVLVQFCIAPLSVVQSALAFLGLRVKLERAVEIERGFILQNLARGSEPFSGRSRG